MGRGKCLICLWGCCTLSLEVLNSRGLRGGENLLNSVVEVGVSAQRQLMGSQLVGDGLLYISLTLASRFAAESVAQWGYCPSFPPHSSSLEARHSYFLVSRADPSCQRHFRKRVKSQDPNKLLVLLVWLQIGFPQAGLLLLARHCQLLTWCSGEDVPSVLVEDMKKGWKVGDKGAIRWEPNVDCLPPLLPACLPSSSSFFSFISFLSFFS